MKVFQYPKDRLKIARFCSPAGAQDPKTDKDVQKIIDRVRKRGDAAIIEMVEEFDKVKYASAKEFFIPKSYLKTAWEGLPEKLQEALKLSLSRLKAYHERQKIENFACKDKYGNHMEQRVTPIERVGVYVPGGTAAYPSTVLMDIVPAKVAGVKEIVMITPPRRPDFLEVQASLGAAWLAGVDEVVGVGGPLGVAAMAIGTDTLKRVDLIVGPGNKYVAAAKKLLYGEIDIDMIAGPSEITIIADKSTPKEFIAADMLSQAEHDPDAQSVAIIIGTYDVPGLQHEIKSQATILPRKAMALDALRKNGAIINVQSREEAVMIANMKAPEHLEILAEKPRELAEKIPNVGAVFLGPYTPEPVGDYIAGPNHTLPTGGTARFYSPLSVMSFLKTSHIVEFTKEGLDALADATITIAEAEGLTAHAEAVRCRLEKPKSNI
ncbi:MAG: histidinol dehydrogenase [Candidatus Sumerlaeia bacterium]